MFRVIFNWVSKVIFALALVLLYCALWLVGKVHSRRFLNQWEAKPKPMVTLSHAFSRAWRRLHVFSSNSNWFILLCAFVCCDWEELALMLVLRHSIETAVWFWPSTVPPYFTNTSGPCILKPKIPASKAPWSSHTTLKLSNGWPKTK